MGIVIRQSFWGSTLMYAGVAIGYINTLLLMPRFLDMDEIGLIRLIQTNAMLLIPISVLGMNGSLVKYYPDFKKDESLKDRVVGLQVSVLFLINLLIFLIVFLFSEQVGGFFREKSSEYTQYLYITLLILLFQSYFEYLFSFSRSELNIIFPSFLKEVFLRVCNLAFIVLYGLGVISFEWIIYLLTGSYLISTLVFLVFLRLKYHLSLSFDFFRLDRKWLIQIFNFGGYTFLISIGVSIIQNIGFLLTSTYLGLDYNGIFTICTFIGVIIEMPKRAAAQVIGPLVSGSFTNRDFSQIEKVYQKASINLGLISILIALGIISNLNDLFQLIPKGDELALGYYVVLAVGVSKVVSMFFGPSGEILTYSSHRNVMLLLLLSSAVIMIALNVILIPAYGLNGAALASLLTVISDQVFRFFLIKRKMRFTLFTWQHAKLLVMSGLTFLLTWLIPLDFHPVVNIVLRSIFICAFFIPMTYLSNVSAEFNSIINKIIDQVRSL